MYVLLLACPASCAVRLPERSGHLSAEILLLSCCCIWLQVMMQISQGLIWFLELFYQNCHEKVTLNSCHAALLKMRNLFPYSNYREREKPQANNMLLFHLKFAYVLPSSLVWFGWEFVMFGSNSRLLRPAARTCTERTKSAALVYAALAAGSSASDLPLPSSFF